MTVTPHCQRLPEAVEILQRAAAIFAAAAPRPLRAGHEIQPDARPELDHWTGELADETLPIWDVARCTDPGGS